MVNDINNPEQFRKLPNERKQFILDWIAKNIRPIQNFNTHHHSYEMKEWIEEEYPSEYFTNGEFKGAMLESGYIVKDEDAMNWQFNISENSPFLAKEKAQLK